MEYLNIIFRNFKYNALGKVSIIPHFHYIEYRRLANVNLRFVFSILVGLCCLFKAFAQQTQLPDLMPNSPNTEAMQQYGTYPVGNYTGVPSISIPLYMIKSGDIEVPISLNYHASGIKVAQEASWVGLGWSLNAGGSLSKQKRSFDDFGYSENSSLNNYHFRDPIIELTEDNKNGINLTDAQYLQYFESNRRDLFPDLYFYNFLSYSGQFIFDNFPQGVSLKRGDGLKFDMINPTSGYPGNYDYRVKDLKGNIYTFDELVTKSIHSLVNSSNVPVEKTISSWMLKKIKSNTNKEVNFSYLNNGRIQTPSFKSYNSTLNINSIFFTSEDPNVILIDHHLPIKGGVGNEISTTEYIDDIYLTRIDFDEGYVKFITTDRFDLQPAGGIPQVLSKIEIYDKNNKFIKGFEFEYTYVNTTNQNSISTNTSKLSLEKLTEYTEVNGIKTYKNPHVFEYVERPSTIFPIAKNSNNTDHWGYWGKQENKFEILQSTPLDIDIESNTPYFEITNQRHEYGTEFLNGNVNTPIIDPIVTDFSTYERVPPSPGHNHFNYEYLHHAVDTTLNKIYSLKSIIYPTKGKTEFILETNRYGNFYKKYTAAKFAAWQTTDNASIAVTSLPEGPETPVYEFTEKEIYIQAYGQQSNTGLSKSFTLAHGARVRLEFKVDIWTAGAKGILKRQDGTQVLAFVPDSQFSSSFKSVQGVKLPAGDYILEIQNTSSSSFTEFTANYVDLRQKELTEFDYQLGGGLRVKEIKNYDSDGTLTETTHYDYTREGFKYENDPDLLPYDQTLVTKSSGKLLSPIQYGKAKIHDYEAYQELHNPIGGQTANKIRVISVGKSYSSSPIIPVASSANGKSIGYDQVTVSKIDSQGITLGKTVYNYQNQLETVADYGTTIPNEVHLDNGQLLQQEVYNSSGTLLSKLVNNYSVDSYQPYMYGLSRSHGNSEDKLYSASPCTTGIGCRSTWEDIVKYSDYKIKSQWWHLDQTIDTTYNSYGTDPIAKTINYSYNTNSKNYQPSKVVVTTSDSKSIITKTLYPDDIKTATTLQDDSVITGGTVNNLTAIHRLKDDDLHQMATPIQTEVYKDENEDGIANTDELISLQRTNFKEWGTNNLVVPNDVQSLKGVYHATSNTLKDQLEYHRYNDFGNPVEVSQKDGAHIYYIWGYNNQYPIAKIENFTHDDALTVMSLINAAENASDTDDDRTIDIINSNGSMNYQGDEGTLRQKLADIRAHTALNNAQITTYTYDPLIGVTSVTDPRGYTMYYEYDAFNRLKQIMDANGHVLSENEYHYRNSGGSPQ